MYTVTIWLLIATSSSSYNYGNVTSLARFTDKAACEAASKNAGINKYPTTTVFSCLELNPGKGQVAF